MKIFRCSRCQQWVPDWRAYRFRGVIYCTEDLPPEGWEATFSSPEEARDAQSR